MERSFLETTLGRTGHPVFRVGLSATYRPGVATVHKALDEGVNYFFAFGLDGQMFRGLRDALKTNREKCVLATGAYNLLLGHPNIGRTLEKRLRQFRTDYIDVFMYLGVVKEADFPPRLIDEFRKLKESGKVKWIGLSTHARKFAGRLAAEGLADILMVRYNAAHRGAEQDIFPHLAAYDPGVVSFTATRWRYLFRRPSPAKWPREAPLPTPGMAYRFVLSNPAVHVCMMAPSNLRQFEANMKEIREGGPLNPGEMDLMRRFGDAVHHTKTKMFSRDDARRRA